MTEHWETLQVLFSRKKQKVLPVLLFLYFTLLGHYSKIDYFAYKGFLVVNQFGAFAEQFVALLDNSLKTLPNQRALIERPWVLLFLCIIYKMLIDLNSVAKVLTTKEVELLFRNIFICSILNSE